MASRQIGGKISQRQKLVNQPAQNQPEISLGNKKAKRCTWNPFYFLENKRAEQKKGKQGASQWLHAKSAVKLQRDNPWASTDNAS